MTTPPQFPLTPPPELLAHTITLDDLEHHILALTESAATLRKTLATITEAQLDTPYRNWTLRQITHHISDSHLNALIRFKWALTEDAPTIKAYNEDRWTALAVARTAPVTIALNLLDATHAAWVALIRTLTMDELNRTFVHPESANTVRIADMIPHYAWHAAHHTAQIAWRRDHPV
jgi:uncharacterized damage-inducible protein DinB